MHKDSQIAFHPGSEVMDSTMLVLVVLPLNVDVVGIDARCKMRSLWLHHSNIRLNPIWYFVDNPFHTLPDILQSSLLLQRQSCSKQLPSFMDLLLYSPSSSSCTPR